MPERLLIRNAQTEYRPSVGISNVLIEGVSGTGKTTVCHELQGRGHHAINGDRELAYSGDPETGEPTSASGHAHHLWRVDQVKVAVDDTSVALSFFCGGSRNFPTFIDLFDAVFVLEVDVDTLNSRLDERAPDEFGHSSDERKLILRLHHTHEDVPKFAVRIDATAPVERVVDDILDQCRERKLGRPGAVKPPGRQEGAAITNWEIIEIDGETFKSNGATKAPSSFMPTGSPARTPITASVAPEGAHHETAPRSETNSEPFSSR